MDELRDIKVEIDNTKKKLSQAEVGGNEALVLMYGKILAPLLERQNILESQSGNFLSTPLPNIIRLDNSILISFR